MVLARDLYVLKNYVLTGRKQPFLASYKLTSRCNLACRQCPFHNTPLPDPGYEIVLQTLDRLHQRGSRIVILEGGEPALWRDGTRTIADVIAAAKSRFFCTGMTTNGTLGLDFPVDVLWVSLDGMRETHNLLRAGDLFDRVIENIQRSRHPRLYAHLTANRVNADEIPELVRQLSRLVKGITVQFYYPYGDADDLFLPLKERARLIERLLALKRAGLPLLNSVPALKAVQAGRWRCQSWLIDCANPDGSLSQGCYLQGRAAIDCSRCGFTPYTEISLAYQGNLRSIAAGLRIFF